MTDDDTDDPIDADLSTHRVERTYDVAGGERPSEAVVRAVAALTDTGVLDLQPLYEVIDPERLDGTFEVAGDDGPLEETSVTFRYEGCRVTVRPGVVRVSRHDRGGS